MDELLTLHDDGVFLRREALTYGYLDDDLRSAVRTGRLVRVRQGAYAAKAAWESSDATTRHLLRAHAVLRSHTTPLALSHVTAAAHHGLRLHEPDFSTVHVTPVGRRLGRTTHDITYHQTPVAADDLVEFDPGQLAVAPVRAAVETAAMQSVPAGLVVLDSFVDLGLGTVDDVRSAVEAYRGPGARRLQITGRLVRAGANSVGESLSRHLFFTQHLPEPVLQYEVLDAHGFLVGRTDFAWPEYGVLGEFDGRVKYGRLRREGETVEQAVMREKTREDRIRELTGWLMIRLTWSDLYRAVATAARVREQLRRGRRLVA